jgi:hypothetical protein
VLDLLVVVQMVFFFFNMYSRHLLLIAVELGWIIIMLTPILPFLNENSVCASLKISVKGFSIYPNVWWDAI